MAFKINDAHIQNYHTQWYAVFRKILPLSLIGDLRRVTDRARGIARAKNGSQIQRLQPVGQYDVDQRPLIDYAELPELVDAIATWRSTGAPCGISGIMCPTRNEPHYTIMR